MDLKIYIENELSSSSAVNLANLKRKYLERLLKEICFNLEAEVKFKFNDTNEKRMLNELMDSVKSRISKKGKSHWTKEFAVINNLSNSSMAANLLSHDNAFNPKIGGMKAFLADIINFESIFTCKNVDCKRPKLLMKNFDSVNKKIRCGCGKLEYCWEC
jgi:hypothetical protein